MNKSACKKPWRNDILLVVSLLLAVALLGALLLLTQKSGDTVEVRVDGALWGTYSLHEDRVVDIVTEAGYNRLVIKDGKAFVEAADCPDGICAAHRPIDGTRESIVCLPNRVVVTITAGSDTDAPDVVT